MAGIQYISQKTINNSGMVIGEMKWSYLNTTFIEESLLLKQAFLPLTILSDMGELTENEKYEFHRICDRFFSQGMFLTVEQFKMLNHLLSQHGHQKIIAVYPGMEDEVSIGRAYIILDGTYDQPIKKGGKNKSPNAKGVAAWALNGKRRMTEFTAMLSKHKAVLDAEARADFERGLTEEWLEGDRLTSAETESFRREGATGVEVEKENGSSITAFF